MRYDTDEIAVAATWAIEVVRTAAAAMVLPASSTVPETLADLAAAPPQTSAEAGAFLVSLAGVVRTLGREAEEAPGAFAAALAAADPVGAATPVVVATRGYLLGGACIAALRTGYAVRQDAQRARSALAAAGEPIVEAAGDVLGEAASTALSAMLGEAVTTLSRISADRAPLVAVETGVSLPSVIVAHRLYGDPERSSEVVDRNRVGTPALMPVRFEAPAPAVGRR